jgi:hypothetical protein
VNAFRKSWLAATLALAGLFAAGAPAQSPSGAIIGKAAPGTVVVLHNEGSGLHREITVKGKGRYEARNLPTGTYSVTLRAPDGTTIGPILVAVRVGTATRIPVP